MHHIFTYTHCRGAEYATSKYVFWHIDCFELKLLEKAGKEGH